jgi:hypothetical protein
LPGKKKTSARGVLHAHPLLYFKFYFTLFLLASFYQKQKKLVPTIVVIFVGLLLSCFIMLSINGWFLWNYIFLARWVNRRATKILWGTPLVTKGETLMGTNW